MTLSFQWTRTWMNCQNIMFLNRLESCTNHKVNCPQYTNNRKKMDIKAGLQPNLSNLSNKQNKITWVTLTEPIIYGECVPYVSVNVKFSCHFKSFKLATKSGLIKCQNKPTMFKGNWTVSSLIILHSYFPQCWTYLCTVKPTLQQICI